MHTQTDFAGMESTPFTVAVQQQCTIAINAGMHPGNAPIAENEFHWFTEVGVETLPFGQKRQQPVLAIALQCSSKFGDQARRDCISAICASTQYRCQISPRLFDGKRARRIQAQIDPDANHHMARPLGLTGHFQQ